MPLFLTKSGAFSRVVRTTIGIGLIHLGKSAEIMIQTGQMSMSIETMNEQLFFALQTGLYFGIAYAVVDCVQDEMSQIDQRCLCHFLAKNDHNQTSLSLNETIDQWFSIMEQFDCKTLPNTPFTTMLIEASENLEILTQSTNTTSEVFNELSLLLRSQGKNHKNFDIEYNDEQLYLGKFQLKISFNIIRKSIFE